jgi:L-threonine kinase
VDEGGQVDTVRFNQIPKPFSRREKQEYARLLEEISAAIDRRDLATVGAVATRSAVLNQKLHPKRFLAPMLRIAEEVGALGVIVTHSGSMIGLLLDDSDVVYHTRLVHAHRACAALPGAVHIFHSLCFEDTAPVRSVVGSAHAV